ncbi:DNA-directed RNA polymerase I subunit RPA49-like [Stegodyphus dumicola]|uniref:DNA-directed RNA polymerase I subunit RPA49-like n=1 Tax=Stegodyphus dumicola TaxID=202533 RepID=UPI0015ADA55B|nr:DNA-directed RNA polymerase I subunit RPA49-like [Stegodyphus dumicola]
MEVECELKVSKKLSKKKCPAYVCVFQQHLNLDSGSVTFESYSAGDATNFNRDAKKLIVAKAGLATFTGSSSMKERREDSLNNRYFVGVRNKRTGQMKLYETLLIDMDPTLNICPADEITKAHSYSEAVSNLTASFGSKIQKRALNQHHSFKVETSDFNETLDEMSLGDISLNITESHNTSQSIDYIPPQNRNTITVTDVYNVSDIITPEEDSALDELAANFIKATADDIEVWKKENRYCKYVLSHLDGEIKLEHEKAKYLVYYNYLLSFLKLGYTDIRKKDPATHIPEPFRSKFLNVFTLVSSTESKKSYRTFPQQMKDKLLAHLLVLALFIDAFTTNVALIHSDLRIALNRVVSVFQALGCHVSNRKLNDSMIKTAELKFPLYIPAKYSKK